MIIYLLVKGFDSILSFVIGLIPTFSTPSWFSAMADVFAKIASFNKFFPITETVTIVLFLIAFTLGYKIAKIVLNVAHIDLSK